MNEETHYLRARERVKEIKRVYVHFFVYLIVNVGLVIINFLTNPHQLWFYWALAGWGIGLAAHVFSVFVIGGLFGREWEEKKIQRMMEKMEKKDAPEVSKPEVEKGE